MHEKRILSIKTPDNSLNTYVKEKQNATRLQVFFFFTPIHRRTFQNSNEEKKGRNWELGQSVLLLQWRVVCSFIRLFTLWRLFCLALRRSLLGAYLIVQWPFGDQYWDRCSGKENICLPCWLVEGTFDVAAKFGTAMNSHGFCDVVLFMVSVWEYPIIGLRYFSRDCVYSPRCGFWAPKNSILSAVVGRNRIYSAVFDFVDVKDLSDSTSLCDFSLFGYLVGSFREVCV